MSFTTKDLAQVCGVSRTTVQRALNGNGRISQTTKDYILKAAKENGYRPDLLARGLVKGRTFSIGVVVLNVKNRYFAHLLDAIGTEANKRGYFVNITIHNDDREKEKEQIARLADYHVDGIIVSSVNYGKQYKDFLANLGIPIVSVDNRIETGIPFVGIHQREAMKEAAQETIKKGYQKLVFVCPPLGTGVLERNLYVHKERMEGFKEAVDQAGVEGDILLSDDYLSEAVNRISLDKKTAFLCSGDNFALDLMKTLEEQRKFAPKDYGIVGFDNIDTLDYVHPRLTSIGNSVNEVADEAVNLLFDLIDGKENVKKDRMLPYFFVPGETI